MYKLPNNVKIDDEGLFDAFLDHDKNHEYYLDSVKGSIGFVDISTRNSKKRILDPKRYLKISSINLLKKCKWLQDFINEFVSYEDKVLAGKLREFSQNVSGYDKAVSILKNHPDGWEGGWSQWERDHACDEVDTWIQTLPVTISEDWDLDCDCELCKLLKNGPHSVGDFVEASQKQNKKNGVGIFGTGDDLKKMFKSREDDKDDLYYESMDLVQMGDYLGAEKLLLAALALDVDYVQTYVGLVSVYGNAGSKKKMKEMVKTGFEKTQKVFKKWPKKIEWGFLENRAYMRAIQYRAEEYVLEGEKEKGIELYRLLLNMNPNDNQGVRYVLAGVYAGISGEGVNKMTDEGNRKQNWDHLETMVVEQNKKHKFWKEPRGYR